MTAKDIGTQLVGLCKEGRNLDAIRELYAEDVTSVESTTMDGSPREMQGRDAVLQKGQWWIDNHEVHSHTVRGPFTHGDDKFAVQFEFDVTNKPSGQRMTLTEVGVYELRDGKVVREEFFYGA